jgi:VIT1/CCC1 family predicted Fe2+/Mn2+ transporter
LKSKPENRLAETEVKDRITNCADECIEELYSFGVMMVNESLDTLNKLDAKAYAVAGYSGATFGALVSVVALAKTLNLNGAIWPIALALAALAALAASAASLVAIRFRPVDWFSPNEWFRRDALGDALFLRRYHIFCM